MIQCIIYFGDKYAGQQNRRLLLNDYRFDINETDYVEFKISVPISISIDTSISLVIGDVPVDLIEISSDDNSFRVFKSNAPKKHDSQYFYNFFGESEIKCYLNDELKLSTIVNVKARKTNAILAEQMLDFLNNKLDDVIQLCCSRSHVATVLCNGNSNQNNKLSILGKIVKELKLQQQLFIREHPYNWEHHLEIMEQGEPIGEDSIHWALTNLDRFSPAYPEEANIRIKNRTFRFDQIPSEILIKNTDVYENRVIHSFLTVIKIELISYLKQISEQIVKPLMKEEEDNNFISFDHILTRFSSAILKHKQQEILILEQDVDKLIKLFKTYLPAKAIPITNPSKLTPYVNKHRHYNTLFLNIEQWYRANTPNLNLGGEQFFMGLKNLSSLYELSMFIVLTQLIPDIFGLEKSLIEYRN